jgi:hypothetical protein
VTWIARREPAGDPEVAAALAAALADYPGEYGREMEGRLAVPEAVREDSIVMSHSLIPRALQHFFAGYGALLDESLPLSRRQHEMIATVVSSINRCFY